MGTQPVISIFSCWAGEATCPGGALGGSWLAGMDGSPLLASPLSQVAETCAGRWPRSGALLSMTTPRTLSSWRSPHAGGYGRSHPDDRGAGARVLGASCWPGLNLPEESASLSRPGPRRCITPSLQGWPWWEAARESGSGLAGSIWVAPSGWAASLESRALSLHGPGRELCPLCRDPSAALTTDLAWGLGVSLDPQRRCLQRAAWPCFPCSGWGIKGRRSLRATWKAWLALERAGKPSSSL